MLPKSYGIDLADNLSLVPISYQVSSFLAKICKTHKRAIFIFQNLQLTLLSLFKPKNIKKYNEKF